MWENIINCSQWLAYRRKSIAVPDDEVTDWKPLLSCVRPCLRTFINVHQCLRNGMTSEVSNIANDTNCAAILNMLMTDRKRTMAFKMG